MNEPQCAFHIDFTRGDIISNFSCAQSNARLRRTKDEGVRTRGTKKRWKKEAAEVGVVVGEEMERGLANGGKSVG